MKYDDSRPRSAEVLRLALARMGEHDAAFNPVTYAVWYEHLSGINARLSRALEPLLATGHKLDDAAIDKLYRSHVAEVDQETAARVSRDFMRVMRDLSETAARTGGSASELGDKLGVLNEALRSKEPSAMAAPVGEALASAGRMRTAVDSLQQQVATSRQEIDRLRAELQRTRDEAALCPLTKVLNRKGFDDQLRAMLAKAAGSAKPGCLVMVDVDHFKQVNDNHGHVVGDRVLASLGDVLRQVAADTGATAARYGGEEFALLLPSQGLGTAVKLAEVVRANAKAMRVRLRNGDKPLTVTISAGVAELCAGDDAASVVARADAALYQSKRQGRDRVTAA